MKYKEKISIILIFFMFISLFYGCSSESKDFETEEKNESIKKLVTEKNPTVIEKGAEITFSNFDLENDISINISKTKAPPLNFDQEITEDYKLDVYEIKTPEKNEFIDLIKIRLDYNPDFIDKDADESRSAFAMYFNPDTNKWETLDYWVDTNNKQVVITTNHLSKYGVFTVKNENTRLAYIGTVNSYIKIVNSEMAQEIINEAINKTKSESEKAKELGMEITNDWLGLSGFLLTTSGEVYSTNFLDNFGKVFNGLGIAAATVQVAIDFQSENSVKLYGNLSKNILNIAVSKWGTSALQLSFAGVFAIDYSLNKFANEAWDGRNNIWYDAYNMHYKEKMKLSPRKWYSKFFWIWQDSLKEKDPNYLKDQINAAINANITAFWQNETTMAFYQGEAMDSGSTGGGGINDRLIENITDAKRAELVKSLQPVFNQLEKKITYYLRSQYRKKLKEVKNKFNRIIKVEIEEVIPEGSSSKYAGYIVKFAPLNEKAKAKTWIGKLDENGSIKTRFTLLAHLQSGQPNTIKLYSPDANIETDKPEKSVEFTISGNELNIKIGDYPPLEEITGSWPGTFLFESVRVPEPKEDSDKTEASCDGYSFDFEEIKNKVGEKTPSTISIGQTSENKGYMWFGDDSSDLEEDKKLYFDYKNGLIKVNRSDKGFTLKTNIKAEYIDDKKIRLYGPMELKGMDGELEVNVLFESKR